MSEQLEGITLFPSMSSAEDSPAKTSPWPDVEQESEGRDRDSGLRCTESLASYDPDTSSWRMSLRSLDGEWVKFSETFPKSGMTRNGRLFPLPTQALPTSESESGLWPTPNTQGFRSDGEMKLLSQKARNYSEYVAMSDRAARSKRDRYYPTPTSRDWKSEECSAEYKQTRDKQTRDKQTRGKTLAWVVRYPTPQSGSDNPAAHNSVSGDFKTRLCEVFGIPTTGKLNPQWVEWLMGFPVGFTDLEPSVTP